MMRGAIITMPLALLLLASCGPVNRGVETTKRAVLETSNLAHDVRFGADNGLTDQDARSLADFLGSVRVSYGDRISIDDPATVGATARRAAIAGIVARFGLLLEEAGPILPGRLDPGTARVIVSRSTTVVPNCPDWRRPSNPELHASTTSNFGCATAGNLAAMIADPNDLVTGRTYTGADGHTVSKAIESFRKRAPGATANGGMLPATTTTSSTK